MGIVAQLCGKTRETNEKDGEEEGQVRTVGWNISGDIIYRTKVSLCNTAPCTMNTYKKENRERGK